MRRNALATLSVLATIALLPCSWAKGQDEYSDPQARLAGLDRTENGAGYAEASSDSPYAPQPMGRPAIYKMTDPATVTNCCNDCNGCNNCNSGNCCSNNSCSNGCKSGCCGGLGGLYAGDPVGGFVGGFEYVWLRPYASNGDLPSANSNFVDFSGASSDRTLNFNFKATPRIYLGYVGANGLGARVRYWQYDHGAGVNTHTDALSGDVSTIAGGLKFQTFDLEATQQSQFGAWNLLMAGGVRYASFSMDSTNAVVAGAGPGAGSGIQLETLNLSGYGFTTALQARRSLNASGTLQFLSNLRGSLLFGNHRSTQFTTSTTLGTTSYNNKNRDDLFSIWEINLGPQWHMPLRNGGRLFVGGTVEAQLWQGVGTYQYSYASQPGNVASNAGGFALGNMGLIGFGGNVGITR